MGRGWDQSGKRNLKVGSEWGQSGKRNLKVGCQSGIRVGPEWDQSGKEISKWEKKSQSEKRNLRVGSEWDQTDPKVHFEISFPTLIPLWSHSDPTLTSHFEISFPNTKVSTLRSVFLWAMQVLLSPWMRIQNAKSRPSKSRPSKLPSSKGPHRLPRHGYLMDWIVVQPALPRPGTQGQWVLC